MRYSSLSGAVQATTLTATGAVRIANSGANPTSHSDASNPALHVAGGMSVNGHVYFNTGVVSNSFTVLSDRRHKRRLRPLEAGVVPELQAMRYDLVDQDGEVVERDTVGFVAQDVQELDPSLVRVDERTGTYSLDYRGIGVHTVAELQRLQRQVDSQQARLDSQQARLDSQQARLDSQQRTLYLLCELLGVAREPPAPATASPRAREEARAGASAGAGADADADASADAGADASAGTGAVVV